MKKRFIIILIVVALVFCTSGCGIRPNEPEITRALELVSKVPIPDRYSQYDGVKLLPQEIEVKISSYSSYTGEQHYRFYRQYLHPKWYLRFWANTEAEVMLVAIDHSYFITKTPQTVYENVDYTKAYFSVDFLEQEFERLSWQ